MQMLHYRQDLGSMSAAQTVKNGVAALGVLFEVKTYSSSRITHIIVFYLSDKVFNIILSCIVTVKRIR
jgi:hypothetical protein